MSYLSRVSTGAKLKPQMYLFVGLPKIGKTSLAAKFPDPLILDVEDGSSHVSTNRLDNSTVDGWTFDKLLAEIYSFKNGGHSFKTLIVDSLSAVQQLATSKILIDNNITALGDLPYGQGPDKLRSLCAQVVDALKRVQSAGYSVIVPAHIHIKQFTDPTLNSSYDRYTINADQKVADYIMSQADNIFFCAYKVETEVDRKTKKTQASGGEERVMYTEYRAGHVGGNRLSLPYELPMDYDALMKAIEAGAPKNSTELKAEISNLIKLGAEKVDAKMLDSAAAKTQEAGDDQVALTRIRNKLKEIVAA